MPLTPYQIVVPILSLVAVAYAWNLVSRGKKTASEAVLWTLFWGGIGLISLFPFVLSYIALITGIKDQVNAILVSSIGVLFFIVFYLVVRLEDVRQQQSRLLRSIALMEAGLVTKSEIRSTKSETL